MSCSTLSCLHERPGRVVRLFERWNATHATAGVLALAALVLGVVTGVVLAIGYDVDAAGSSLQLIELSSRSGRLLRAVHAWTGHGLILLTAVHVVEHLARATYLRPRYDVWLRLVVSIPLLFGVPLTGFILKADAEGSLAREVVGGLLERLPVVGKAVAAALVGTGDDLQLVYVHHVATFTLVVVLVAVEHGRRVWPTAGSVLAVLFTTLLLGWLVPPGLHDGVDLVVKGPWYFVGLQEILHWLGRPGWLWLLLLVPLAAFLALPRLKPAHRRQVLLGLGLLLVVYAGLTIWASLFRGGAWRIELPFRAAALSSRLPRETIRTLPMAVVPDDGAKQILGQRESCLACHSRVSGLATAHDPTALGCFSCHLGNPFAPDANGAHAGLVRVPGNLDTAMLSCGRSGCHDVLVGRVRGSLMATVRGMIAVDRFAFGEQETPDGEATVAELDDSAADTHLRQMCVSCHLGRIKTDPAPAGDLSRGGGCVACHIHYSERRDYSPENSDQFTHPALTVQVENDGCFGCHSRSGRISLGYAGWWESALEPNETGSLQPGSWRQLGDGRILRRSEPDVHQARGMACIDCHTAREVMGDGEVHLHEDAATRVRCETCHRTTAARDVALADAGAEVRAIARLRHGANAPPRVLLEDRSGEPLSNAWPSGDRDVEVRGKLSGKRHLAKPPAPACAELDGHSRLSCRACHAAWVTHCVSCHTQLDANGRRTDLLSGEELRGRWIEYASPPLPGPPVLGVRVRSGRATIEPFAPGMIMTLNTEPQAGPLPDEAQPLYGPGTRFLRAFAPAVPHTTSRSGRSCQSCHLEPLALGYGRGTLALVEENGRTVWRFEPTHGPLGFDGLPSDAWIGFLTEPVGARATRSDARPLSLEEQRRTLEVGACLTCHDPASPGGARLYASYRESRSRLSPLCRVPE